MYLTWWNISKAVLEEDKFCATITLVLKNFLNSGRRGKIFESLTNLGGPGYLVRIGEDVLIDNLLR